MAWTTSHGFGQYVAAETHRFWADRLYKTDATKRVVVWCHGAGADYQIGPHEAAFAAAGVPIIATDLGGGQTWGSDTSVGRITTAWNYAKTNFGVKTDKMVLWGGSMGSLTALLYAQNNPSNVAAVGCALPIVDPEQVRSEDAGGYQSEIEAVHTASIPTAKRPNQNTASYTMPIHLFASSNDTVGDYGLAEDFADAVPTCEFSNIGALGHSYLSMAHNPALEFVQEFV